MNSKHGCSFINRMVDHGVRHSGRDICTLGVKNSWHNARYSGRKIQGIRGSKPMRILLIEDDLIAARGVILMLKASGAVVDHADTGEEGLELVPPLRLRHRRSRSDAAGHRGLRSGAADAGRAQRHAGADPFRPVAAAGQGEGSWPGRGRLHHQAVRQGGTACPDAGHRPAEQGVQPTVAARRSAAAEPGQPRGAGRRTTGASDRQGVRDPRTAGAAQGNGADQGGIPQPSIRRHG